MATSIEVVGQSGSVELLEGITVPRRVRVKIEGDAADPLLPFDGTATLTYQRGRLEVTAVNLRQTKGGPPIRGEALRNIHRVLAQTVVHVLQPIRLGPGPGLPLLSIFAGWADPQEVAAGGPTDEALSVVAAAYRLSNLVGDAPAKSVQKLLGLPRSTTGRWIMLARQRGFLGAAEERKAGEEV